MKEVAAIANVSVQTVSAVINEKPGITEETRLRVLAIVQELDYRPYWVAQSLRTRQTKTIALLISNISNPVFATIASAAEDYAYSVGYSLVVYNTHDDVEREARYIRMASERWVEGLIFVAAQDNIDKLQALESAGIPAVAIDRLPERFTGPVVTLDNREAGRLAAEHLLALGHTRIGHISGPLRLRLARERLEGFRTTIEAHGLALDAVAGGDGNWECEDGYRAMQELLARQARSTALFCANDRMAIGAIRAAIEGGMRVPEDLSVVGLDDLEVAPYQNPPLTTVRQSFAELATRAVQLLLDILAEREPVETQIVLAPTLVVRQSTAIPRTTA
jgi:DNA-binding LacI/PurR family transcriptional regulator